MVSTANGNLSAVALGIVTAVPLSTASITINEAQNDMQR